MVGGGNDDGVDSEGGGGSGGGGALHLFLPSSTQPELSAPVSAVLRFVLLERVISTRKGYVIADTLTRARIVCVVLLTFQLATWVVRRCKHLIVVSDIVSNIMNAADLLVSVSMTMQCIFAIASTALDAPAAILAYRASVLRLDNLLEPEQPHTLDVTRFRRLFACVFGPKIMYLAVETTAWAITYGFIRTWPHYGDGLCKAISDLASLYHATRLIEVENRTAALERRLRQTAAAAVLQWPSALITGGLKTISNAMMVVHPLHQSEARECYLLLCEMCATINNTFAFQVVLGFVRSFIMITSVIHQLDSVLTHPEMKNFNTEGKFVSLALLPVVVYLCGVVQVVFIAVLQVEYSASVVRLHRNIVLHAETLAAVPAATTAAAQGAGGQETQMFWSALATLCHRQPLHFTACGFFDLNYSLLVTMFGAVVTYTVLLIQMNDSSH